MDELLQKVRQLNRRVQILDGYDDDISRECLKLLESIKEIKCLIAERKKILQNNQTVPEDQMRLINRLRVLQARMAYMNVNFPRGIIRFENDNSPARQTSEEVSSVKIETSDENVPVSQTNYSSPQPTAEISALTVPTPKPRGDLQISVSYVSNLEFQNVPPYMKGRLKVTDVNLFIDYYNNTLTKKYELLKKSKNTIKVKNELDKFINWKSQITSDTTGLYFCTADDFFTESGIKFGKKEFSLITVLRHMKRIREIRNKKLIYYVACF
uniref:SKA complex subunit 1 n=1 Tax=Triatoma infestans TaxID=30076 RepID=A0A023F001_TRIIF